MSDSGTKCPNCGRLIEEGFRFCDSCGTKLAPGPLETPKPETPKPETPKTDAPDTKERKPPLLERMRARVEEEKVDESSAVRRPPAEPAKNEPPPAAVPPVPAVTTPAPPRVTSKPMRAEELRGQEKVGIAGRLRWREHEDEDEDVLHEPPATTWHPVPTGREPGSLGAQIGRFILHVVLAFAAGAALLAIAAIVASLTSDGRVALLEVRGLPIFVAGATAIIVFSLLRTGPRAVGDRRSVAIGVLAGFIVLVAAVALVYQPSLMARAQKELDNSLGVFGGDVEQAVNNFGSAVDQWNAEVGTYRETHLTDLDNARDNEADPDRLRDAEERFRIDASRSEEALDGIYKRMRSHADAVTHAPLRDALRDLAAVFGDELSGIKLITRGFVNDDQALIQGGNTRFKGATVRAVELFEDRVRPLLERGDIEPGNLEASVSELARPAL